MILTSVEALIIRIPGYWDAPDRAAAYPAREIEPVAPGEALETVLARVTTDTGLAGWGESQVFSAPEVAGAIIHSILKPVIEGKAFNGAGLEIEAFWNAMYNRMRTSGQTGGFMLDAMAAVDIALWDLAGKMHRAPIAALIAGPRAKKEMEVYLNSSGAASSQNLECARAYRAAGCRKFKIFHRGCRRELLEEYDALAGICGPENIAVDALWRLDPGKAAGFGAELDRRGALWLECPFAPEDPAPHAALAAQMRTPIALGETYRTHFEVAPFFRMGAMRIVQPALGRCGITEALRIARAAERAGALIVPHLTPALGPLLYATLQFAAAVANCLLVPYSPALVETADKYCVEPVAFRKGRYAAPLAPGLGMSLVEPEVRLVAVA
ncbi:MAG: mandelate racemase/muconate lactonizing enzyme family protein [Acidobacteriia bacterium]|nr:mandelate racemase/muconate lactonizing enzyme family protein [Terriglobia bacterium]